MKYSLQLIALLFLIFNHVGCSKKSNDDTEKTPEQLLIGKWKLIESYTLDGNDIATDCERRSIMEFFPDNSMHWESYQQYAGGCSEYFYHLRYDVSYELDGNKMVIRWVNKPGEPTGGGSIDNNTYEVNDTKFILRLTPAHKGVIFQRIN